MLQLDAFTWVVTILVSGMAGVAKVAFGVGAGAFLTPILALVLPPKVAVGVMAPIMLVTDLSALRHHWRKWETRYILVLLPTMVAGILVGTSFLAWASTEMVGKAIGLAALLYVAIQFSRFLRGHAGSPSPLPTWAGWAIGFAGGITTSVAHAGGVVFSVYLLAAGLTKSGFIATVVSLFFVSNLLKFPLYWETGILSVPILLTGLALTPVMLLGGWLGMSLNRLVSVDQFSRMVVVIVCLSGLLLLITE